ncbi:hypothetical protein O3G_MSEX006307 [Manduca sexta]|uniref:Hexosyltransferase n=1 Tax=Manduca sexta TaxID=7130 RepID=A0A922CL39_MANSE|nr:hypothetical protein O3G_MSEX006307 [Manduca sexta]
MIMNLYIMKKKLVFAAILAISLISWIYWSSSVETNDTFIILSRENYLYHNFLIEPRNTTCKGKPFLIIIVTSYVGHVELRSAHRRAMPPELLRSLNIARIFLLARIPENEKLITQAAIKDESEAFDDILQGSFVENYRNLTYKHLMGLQWASTNCYKAKFILKVDDDIVFNLNKSITFMKTINKTENLVMGYVLEYTKPRRNKENKWYVTWDEYSRNYYPPYLSGWYYITTPKVATLICDEATYHPKFWIDDILITGILTESLGFKLQHLPNDYWLEYYELLECCLRDMIDKSIMCNHVVGPNGGRNNLIVEFNEAVGHCESWKNCTQRSSEKPLKKVCIVNSDRTIFSNGQGQVELTKL